MYAMTPVTRNRSTVTPNNPNSASPISGYLDSSRICAAVRYCVAVLAFAQPHCSLGRDFQEYEVASAFSHHLQPNAFFQLLVRHCLAVIFNSIHAVVTGSGDHITTCQARTGGNAAGC